MTTLAKEMDASPSVTDGYKKDVVLGLLYKVCYRRLTLHYLLLCVFAFSQFYISCVGSDCSPAVTSASSILLRPLSGGSQTFSPTPSEYPAGMPIDKLAAQIQVQTILGWHATTCHLVHAGIWRSRVHHGYTNCT